MSPIARVVRRSELSETPWRNGGGVTYEIAREPRTGTLFDWRLSLARIDSQGPFSDFSGYERALTLVSGAGCRLRGVREEPIELREVGATALFDGGAAVSCELLAGRCLDLNLMTARPGRILAVEYFSLLAHDTEALRKDACGAVFCLEGSIECLHLQSGRRITLGVQDAFIAPAAEAGEWRLMRGASDRASVVTHAWTPG
jgi:environmental stress-induced protein Ves